MTLMTCSIISDHPFGFAQGDESVLYENVNCASSSLGATTDDIHCTTPQHVIPSIPDLSQTAQVWRLYAHRPSAPGHH